MGHDRLSIDWFWGKPPRGGVPALRQPVFYRDQNGLVFPNGLAWSSCMAHGAELRFAGLGIPTGFEWHLILLELLTFSIVWRFQGSVYLAATLSYRLNRVVLRAFAVAG